MEIPKEVIAVRTQEEADAYLQPYCKANYVPFDQLTNRENQYWREHPELIRQVPTIHDKYQPEIDYPADLGSGLEFICLVKLLGLVDILSSKRAYTFEADFFGIGYKWSHLVYFKSRDMAMPVKEEMVRQTEKVHGSNVLPLVYTIDSACNGRLTEAEREEFTKAFFTG